MIKIYPLLLCAIVSATLLGCNPRTQVVTIQGDSDNNKTRIETQLRKIPEVDKIEFHPQGNVLIWTKDKKPIPFKEIQEALREIPGIQVERKEEERVPDPNALTPNP